MPAISRVWGIYVSEGGLGPRPWWYIPKPGIYHQSKLPRQGPPGPASRRRIAAAPPGPHDQSEHLTCGNDDRGSAGIELLARTGRRHPHRGAPSSGRQGDSLPLLPEDSAPQPQPPRTSPDDLAAELNPHKTELNPHKAVEAASAPEQINPAFRARARARRRGSWQRRSCHARDPLCPSRSATATGRACARVAAVISRLQLKPRLNEGRYRLEVRRSR